MSEQTGDMPDLEVPDVDLPDVDTPGLDGGPQSTDPYDVPEMPDAYMLDADPAERMHAWFVEHGYTGPFDDEGRPCDENGNVLGAIDPTVDSDGSAEAWYQKQVAGYGQPRGTGAGTGRSRRRGLFGARTTNGAGGGGGFRLGSLLNVNIRFGGGARTTNVTGLSIGARPGAGARIASRRRR